MAVNKLNLWVYIARFLSGALNVGMLLSIGSMLTLHTGTLTQSTMYLVTQEWHLIVSPLVALTSYFLGSLASGAYYGKLNEKMSYKYWHGYLAIAIMISFLWIPDLNASAAPIVILSFSMGVMCAMSLDNKGYIGTITMMTGLITSLAKEMGYWLVQKQSASRSQAFYLFKNLVSYVLGAGSQTLLYLWTGEVSVLPFVLLLLLLSFWSYRYGER